MLEFKLLILLLLANGAPVIAWSLFKDHGNLPVDFGIRLVDGQPVFGPSKTWRGLFASLIATACSAPLLALPWETGLRVAAAAMLGDLLASFLKRRLKIAPSGKAWGLDQIPESLFPLLLVKERFHLDGYTIAQLVAAFFLLEVLLSPWLYQLGIRKRPY